MDALPEADPLLPALFELVLTLRILLLVAIEAWMVVGRKLRFGSNVVFYTRLISILSTLSPST